MYTVDILVETDQVCSLYRVEQSIAEQLLRTETTAQAHLIILAYGKLMEVFSIVEPCDGQIYLDANTDDNFGEFQNALMDLICDLDVDPIS
jgi:hypothetical protein